MYRCLKREDDNEVSEKNCFTVNKPEPLTRTCNLTACERYESSYLSCLRIHFLIKVNVNVFPCPISVTTATQIYQNCTDRSELFAERFFSSCETKAILPLSRTHKNPPK